MDTGKPHQQLKTSKLQDLYTGHAHIECGGICLNIKLVLNLPITLNIYTDKTSFENQSTVLV